MSKFYPYQQVLVRNSSKEEWCPNFFDKETVSNFVQGKVVYWTVGQNCFDYCIPYEGNEKYIHTTDTPEPEWKPEVGELIEVSDYLHQEHWHTRQFVGMDEQGRFLCKLTGADGFIPPVAWRHIRKLQKIPKESEAKPESSDWHPTPGELIEVSNTGADDTWVKAKFIEMEDQQYVCSVNLGVHLRLLWPYARKLQEPQKKAEDTPESSEWKPTPGELVAVRDYDDDGWAIRWFKEIHTDGTYKCIMWAYPDNTVTWNQCISIDALKKLEHPHKECKHSIPSEIKSEDNLESSEWKPTPGEIVAVHNRYVGEWELGKFSHMYEDQYVCYGLLEYEEYTHKWDVCRSLKCFIK